MVDTYRTWICKHIAVSSLNWLMCISASQFPLKTTVFFNQNSCASIFFGVFPPLLCLYKAKRQYWDYGESVFENVFVHSVYLCLFHSQPLSLSWIVTLRCSPMRDLCSIRHNPYYASCMHTNSYTSTKDEASYKYNVLLQVFIVTQTG